MDHPLTAPWGMRISNPDFDRLKSGFKPESMDHKWECSASAPDAKGSVMVCLSRSWTGRQQIVMVVDRCSDGDGAEIVQITWDQGSSEARLTEMDGKAMATSLCKSLMGCVWTFQVP